MISGRRSPIYKRIPTEAPLLPAECPFVLDQLVDPELDLDRLVAIMARP